MAGGDWAALQTAAWVGMIADYGRSHGVGKAVVMTFDGDHPCAMCRKIEAVKKRQSDSDLPGGNLEKVAKRDPVIPPGKRIDLRPPVFSRFPWQNHHLAVNSRREAPPLPPPRVGLA